MEITSVNRRPVALLASLVLAATLVVVAPATAANEPCRDAAHSDYDSHDCRVQRLQERSFVVVAIVDTGINPYHVDFRLPADEDMLGVHPSEFIDGYPEHTPALDLTLDADSYHEARAADADVWAGARFDQLYHVPGTKIVGAYTVEGSSDAGDIPVLDEHGHGTAVGSVAAGFVRGSTTEADVVLVSVSGIGAAPARWAKEQPWVDIVSNSWGYVGNVGLPLVDEEHHDSRAAYEEGKVVAYAAGNGVSGTGLACDRALTTTSGTSAPSWIVSVGAVSPRNGQSYCWHSFPPHVSSYGLFWPAAEHDSLDGERDFGGTSNATPLVAGVMAEQLLEARRLLGDTDTGARDGVLAVAADGADVPAEGPLADGQLTNRELMDVTYKTAEPEDFDAEAFAEDPFVTPTLPGYYVFQGYGIVNAESKARALEVIRGEADLPDRSEVDEWMELRDGIHDTLWSNV